MKTRILITCALLLSTSMAQAQNQWATQNQSSQPYNTAMAQAVAPMDQDISYLQKEWAHIKYQIMDEDRQLDAIHRLEMQAASVTVRYPDRAEPKIWEAIILSTDAGIVKGLSALSKVEKAKELLEMSLTINPNALDGSAYTSLGSLYYQVPGWPIAFGDDDEAEKHLKIALSLNPHGIDPNFFYGDFLLEDGRYDEAKTYLEHALQAPPRPSRPLADAGRRQEIKAALAKINQKMKDAKKSRYN